RGARRRQKVPLTIERDHRIPAQWRETEERQRHVAQYRVARKQRDDLISARDAEMRAISTRQMGNLAVEQQNGSAVRRQLAGDQIEQRRLAGAVRADDQ